MLSNVAYVILGFLSSRPRSGYDIKQVVDSSTRFFFAASYGQIYPQLKVLEEAGLIAGLSKQQGQRSRTEYTITEAGREVLEAWIDEAFTKVEFRDEGVLRLFFADTEKPEQRLRVLKAMRADRATTLAVLRNIKAQHPDEPGVKKGLALDYGLGLFEYTVDWCDRTIAELEQQVN